MSKKSVPAVPKPELANGMVDTPWGRFEQRQRLQASLLKKQTAQDQLVDRMLRRLDAVQNYLADDRVWFDKLEKAPLRDIAIMEGIWIDKVQVLQGKATTILGAPQQAKLDEVLPLLQQALKQRGLTVALTERTIEVTT